MSGTTNVGQNEFEFRLLQCLEKEKKLTVEEKQSRDMAIKIRKYMEENGEIELPLKSNKEIVNDEPTR